MRLDSISITRAQNGWVVAQSKRMQSKERPWMTETRVFLQPEKLVEYLAGIIPAWTVGE